MNPILPPDVFIPDGEPRVFEFEGERRLFLYGSRDERVTAFCGFGHDAWSAPLDNLNQWRCHGEIFHVSQVQAIGYGKVAPQIFGAPDCVYNPVTGKYYLYTFLGRPYRLDGKEGPLADDPNTVSGFAEFGPKCVVASSDSPAGPFVDPVMCDWPAYNSAGAFDPGVLVDEQDDGSVRVYAYWGMKRKGDRCAEIDPVDMHTIIDPVTRAPDRKAWRKTLPAPEQINGSFLFEANSIRKIADGKYAFIYSAGKIISSLTYCYGDTPFGPWRYGGRIVDNSLSWIGGNNHGSIVDVEGQWYVFYHRQTTNSFNRQAMMEPIEVSVVDGRVEIPMVEMTSQGCDTQGLEPFQRYNIGVCCHVEGPAYIDGQQRCPDGLNPMVKIESGTEIGIKYFNFDSVHESDECGLVLHLNIQLQQEATLRLCVCDPGEAELEDSRDAVAEFDIDAYTEPGETFSEVTVPLNDHAANGGAGIRKMLQGRRSLLMSFHGGEGELCQIKEFEIQRRSIPWLSQP